MRLLKPEMAVWLFALPVAVLFWWRHFRHKWNARHATSTAGGRPRRTRARRDFAVLTLATLAMATLVGRVLLTLQTTASLRLLDLRFHAGAWPVLQSLRYNVTQGLSQDAHALGYDGIIYRSAQQYGSDCVVLFGAGAMRCMRLVSKLPLVSPSGALHRAAADAIRGAKIPLTP